MNYERPELLDRLAAEYVLGTLRGRARRRFEQIHARSQAARSAVGAWQERLAPLAASVPPMAAPARVWTAIDARTQPARAAARPQVPARAPWWQSLWKPALGFAFGTVLAVGLVQTNPSLLFSVDSLAQREQTLPQSYVGLLTDGENRPTLLVSSTRHGTRVSVKFLRPVTVPPGKVVQVWALPAEGAPFPLGVAAVAAPPKSTQFEMSASSEQLLAKVTRLAVSLEDAPEQAGATPSAFIYSGFCVKLW
jgi:anti-sigma-K factor RskA